MYEPERLGETEVWQRKYAEIMDGLDRAEALWMAATERLDRAQAAG
jgi:ATP-binding cassette subfamily F protein 3